VTARAARMRGGDTISDPASARQPQPGVPLSSAEASAAAMASKLLASLATYPAQVVRARLQQRPEGRALVYGSSAQAVALTWRREGLAGFYRGLAPSLVRVLPQSAITLAVYEAVLAALRGTGTPEDGELRSSSGSSSSSCGPTLSVTPLAAEKQGGSSTDGTRR
jgi:Mitochondrial carrier protein